MTVSKTESIIPETKIFTRGIYRGASQKSKAENMLLQKIY
jgi:hypothetical protein